MIYGCTVWGRYQREIRELSCGLTPIIASDEIKGLTAFCPPLPRTSSNCKVLTIAIILKCMYSTAQIVTIYDAATGEVIAENTHLYSAV